VKTAVYDLETTNLRADIGRILCGSILDHHTKEIFTYKTDHHRTYDDRSVCGKLRDKLQEYDILVGWHVRGFDFPFLQTRLFQNNMNLLGSFFVIDPMYKYRGWHGLLLCSSKLKNVAEFLNLKERKDELDKIVWTKAMGGHKESIDRLTERCDSDIRITDEAYTAVKPFIKNISRMGTSL